jgi:hypothetical protein
MQFNYDEPAKFVLDRVHFLSRGDAYSGQGFMEWKPESGFHIDVLLNKPFGRTDVFKTAGLTFVHAKEDFIQIKMAIRGVGFATARTFPTTPGRFLPDNHFSVGLEGVVFFSRRPYNAEALSKFWVGSAVFLTSKKLEFPDHVKTETTLDGKPYEYNGTTGLSFQDDENWQITGRSVSAEKFELAWSLNRNRWKKNDVWRFGEAARRALAVVSAQTVWIAKQRAARESQIIEDVRQSRESRQLGYYLQPLLGDDAGAVNSWHFNKTAFLKLTEFFLQDSPNTDVCWKIFCQIVDASRQSTTQGKELLLSTILEAILRTLYKHPYKEGIHDYKWRHMVKDMERFKSSFLGEKWEKACEHAMKLNQWMRNRNAHPDWLTSLGGALSKEEIKKSTASMVFLSRFYGYMILGMAGFKDMKPMFPKKLFADEA